MILTAGKWATVGLWCVLTVASVTAQDQPHLRLVEDSFDFGCVGVDFKIRHEFKLVNYGPDAIKVDTVTGHCDCTEVRFVDSLVAPGDTTLIQMILNTANLYGPTDKDLRIHTSDPVRPVMYAYYTANVGQWLASVVPEPVSIFFLPGKTVLRSRIKNNALDEITLIKFEQLNDIMSIRVVEDEASRGEYIELEVTPRADLGRGTHLSNFTVTLGLPDDLPQLRITIPVKAVRY